MHRFQGYETTQMQWNFTSGDWTLTERFADDIVIAKTVDTEVGFPTGVKTWQGSCFPNSGDNEEGKLKLTQCGPDRFSCSTFGDCLPMTLRCNGRVDCQYDSSDEVECDLFQINKFTYQKRQTPRESMNLGVRITIKDIQDIQELQSTYTLRLLLEMIWYEDRLSFKNLKPNAESNIVSEKLFKQVWLPVLVFDNSNVAQKTKADSSAKLMIARLGQPGPEKLSEVHENLLYPGKDNPLVLARSYIVTLSCTFQLTMFPFDSQQCSMVLRIPSYLQNQLSLKLISVHQAKDITLSQYEYTGFKPENSTSNSKAVTVLINLERKWGMYMATTFLPTICLILVAELTLFIDESHFEATIMVALTAMLVMYTLYQSVSNALPATSYIKLIDIWLLAGLILPFIVFLVLIIVDMSQTKASNQGFLPTSIRVTPDVEIKMRGEGNGNQSFKSSQKKIEKLTSRNFLKVSRIIILSVTFIFFIVFFTIGLSL